MASLRPENLSVMRSAASPNSPSGFSAQYRSTKFSTVALEMSETKALLRRHRVDRDWATEVAELRNELVVEERF